MSFPCIVLIGSDSAAKSAQIGFVWVKLFCGWFFILAGGQMHQWQIIKREERKYVNSWLMSCMEVEGVGQCNVKWTTMRTDKYILLHRLATFTWLPVVCNCTWFFLSCKHHRSQPWWWLSSSLLGFCWGSGVLYWTHASVVHDLLLMFINPANVIKAFHQTARLGDTWRRGRHCC